MDNREKHEERDLTLDIATNPASLSGNSIPLRYDEDAWKNLKEIIDRNNELLEDLGDEK